MYSFHFPLYRIRKYKFLYLIAFILFYSVSLSISSATVHAATYYVDGNSIGGTCSDVALGTSLGAPWCTVQKAASSAVAGDTINIRGGTYREVVTPTNSGTNGSPITYQSYQSEVPIVSAAILGTGFASLASTEASTGLFTDGFENNDSTFQNYNAGAGDTVDAGNTLLIQATTKNNGDYALAATFGGTNRNARVATTLTTPSADVYQRMYFRIDSDYNIIANDVGQIIMNLRVDSSNSRGSVELLQNASNQFYLRGRAFNPATGLTGIFGTTVAGSIVPDTWYLLEYRYKGGDAVTGGAQMWLNSSSTGSVFTYNTSTTTIGRAEWGGGTSGTAVAAAGSTLYIDDVRVATSSIGAFVAAGPSNTYKMINVTGDPNNIFENNARMATGSSPTSLTAGMYYYDSVGDILYIRTSDSSNPSTKTIDIPFWNEGFLIVNKQYLVFDDIAVKYNDGAGGLDGAYVIATSSNITVQNADIVDNFGSGVYLHRASSSTISNNQLLRNQRDFGGGLRFENGSDNNIVVDNTITGLGVAAGNGINLCGDGGCGYVGNDNNTIRRNTFYNLRDSCVYVGSLSDNNILEQNSCGLTFRANGVGGTGFHVSRGSDFNIIRNNIFFDMYGASIVVQSNTIDAVETSVYGNQILNNVIYNSATSVVGNHGGISVLDQAYDTIIKNNIIYQANDVSGLRVTGQAATSTIADYNLYYSTQPTVTNMFHWGVTSGTFYTNLANFRVAYPALEANSISVDPQFILASALNFLLATTSPAIDIGTTTALVTNDYIGVTRPQSARYDLGVYERLSSADITAPLITAIASTTGNISATITWTTNEAANSQVSYGPTTAYGATTTLDASLVTSHSVVINSLSPSTLYHFRIRTADSSGNVTFSGDTTMRTTAVADITSPTVSITSPSGGATISGLASVISATASDNIGVAGVQFKINGTNIGSEDTSAPYTTLANTSLFTDGSVSLLAVVRDTLNNYATSSTLVVTVDNTSPILSAIASSTGNTSATITWTTNEAGDSQINYGLSSSYSASTTLDTADVTSHTVTLSGLTASTLYHFRVRSRDAANNLQMSSDQTFTTTAAASSGGGSSGGGGSSSKKKTVATTSVSSPLVIPAVAIIKPITPVRSITPIPLNTSCLLTTSLSYGMSGASVSQLQRMLGTDSAVYPEKEVTGFYGLLTQKAIERFQLKYGIITSGTPQTTGYGNVGPQTRLKLNEVYCSRVTGQGSSSIIPQASTNFVLQAKILQLLTLLAELQAKLAALKKVP